MEVMEVMVNDGGGVNDGGDAMRMEVTVALADDGMGRS